MCASVPGLYEVCNIRIAVTCVIALSAMLAIDENRLNGAGEWEFTNPRYSGKTTAEIITGG
jgi:hypothetical protein